MLPYFYFPSFHLGPVTINTWGFFVSLGFAIAIWIAYKRVKSLGLDSNKILDLSFWIIIVAMIGARLGHVFFYEWGYYSQHLKEIIRIDQGGLSSYGGFIGAAVVFFVYRRKMLNNIWHYADALMFALPLGWAIGRIGCFLIHDHPGVFTNFVLGIKYPDGARHDLGLYESIGLLVYWFISAFVIHHRYKRVPGFYTASLMIFYGIFRFSLDFLRVYNTRYFGLTPAQYGSILLCAIGIWIVVHRKLYSKCAILDT